MRPPRRPWRPCGSAGSRWSSRRREHSRPAASTASAGSPSLGRCSTRSSPRFPRTAVPRQSAPWDGLRALIRAAETREPIDPVRFIGNRSSGRMGLALAERAVRRGAEVTLVAANVSLAAPPGVRRVDVETAADLADALGREFDSSDVLVMAAAPADFRPQQASGEEDHGEGSGGVELDLEPTEDILAALAARRRDDQTIVGFAAET